MPRRSGLAGSAVTTRRLCAEQNRIARALAHGGDEARTVLEGVLSHAFELVMACDNTAAQPAHGSLSSSTATAAMQRSYVGRDYAQRSSSAAMQDDSEAGLRAQGLGSSEEVGA